MNAYMNAYEDNTEQHGVTWGQTDWQARPNTQQKHNQDRIRTTWEPANDKDTALDRALDKSRLTVITCLSLVVIVEKKNFQVFLLKPHKSISMNELIKFNMPYVPKDWTQHNI